MSKMNEFFALPVGNIPVKNSLDLKLFTNPVLKNKYISVMYESSKTSGIAKNIENMVDRNLITPVWLNSGILTTILYKLTGPSKRESIKQDAYAFYSPSDHKIFLFIDNSMSFGFTDNQLLVDLTIHETMHMGAGLVKQKYLKIFEKELDIFYESFLRKYFEIPISTSFDSKNIYTWAFKEFELNPRLQKSSIHKYKDLLMSEFSNLTSLDAKTFHKKITNYTVCILLALTGSIKEIMKKTELLEVSLTLRQAYTNSFGVKPPMNNFYIQELFACSEVIAMLSETTTTTSMYSLFKTLGK